MPERFKVVCINAIRYTSALLLPLHIAVTFAVTNFRCHKLIAKVNNKRQ